MLNTCWQNKHELPGHDGFDRQLLSDLKEMRWNEMEQISRNRNNNHTDVVFFTQTCHRYLISAPTVCTSILCALLPIMEINTGNKFPSPTGRQQDLTNKSPYGRERNQAITKSSQLKNDIQLF